MFKMQQEETYTSRIGRCLELYSTAGLYPEEGFATADVASGVILTTAVPISFSPLDVLRRSFGWSNLQFTPNLHIPVFAKNCLVRSES
jgi:hypothetical protein